MQPPSLPPGPETAKAQEAQLVETVQEARTGDQQAFTQLYEQYYGPICTYVAHLVGNNEAGRDLAQETFIRAWKGLPKLHDDLSFRPWLYRVATNVARSYRQRERPWLARLVPLLPWQDDEQGRRAAQPAFHASNALSVAGPEQQAGEREHIQQVLARLSPQARTCLLLQHAAGFTQREIAVILGISEKSVSAYVSRGCEQFRQIYRQMKEVGSYPPLQRH